MYSGVKQCGIDSKTKPPSVTLTFGHLTFLPENGMSVTVTITRVFSQVSTPLDLNGAYRRSGVDMSQNTGVIVGQSGQAIKLFQAPRKISFTFHFYTQVFHP